MGFKEVKRRLIAALRDGTYQHEARSEINTKNLLLVGAISAADLCDIIRKCNGSHHHSSPHHFDASIEVHVIKRGGWYVKFYFVDPDTVFISVHR